MTTNEGKQVILDEMADTLFVLCWANYADENHLSRSGQNYRDYMPTPADWLKEEATNKAADMYAHIETLWQEQTHNPYLDVVDLIATWANKHGEDIMPTLKRWASDAVMSGVGHGVSWEDDHDPILALDHATGQVIEVEVRSFTEELYGWEGADDISYLSLFHLDDDELVYEGERPKDDAEGFAISIAKWTYILRHHENGGGPIDTNGTRTCGLCMLHWSLGDCDGCPIFAHTGMHGCEGTPYENYEGDDDKGINAPSMPAALARAAMAELDFLIELKEAQE
jgi:hypothetical protein